MSAGVEFDLCIMQPACGIGSYSIICAVQVLRMLNMVSYYDRYSVSFENPRTRLRNYSRVYISKKFVDVTSL